VKAADRIIVIEKGRIIEEGNHAGLLMQGGNYAMLYNTYFRHQSLDYRPDWVDDRMRVQGANIDALPADKSRSTSLT
jgi:ABC-type multidrug transport system ATPase subunit